jgi:asparagine synthase (glutamine-hydrolysing)
MTGLERHLCSPERYTTDGTEWSLSFNDIVQECGELNWDAAALCSMVSFGYVCGDRTLFSGIKREPWLSKPTQNGARLLDIPLHGRTVMAARDAAVQLHGLLQDEIASACSQKKNIFVLLSGGLDSRIVAGITSNLIRSGDIVGDLTFVTWGRDDSRDVCYAKKIARLLNHPIIHLDLTPHHLLNNIDLAANTLGCLISPIHLHRMDWFESVPKESIVLAGSYGDGIGRAEYSKRHIIELELHNPVNQFNLIRQNIFAKGSRQLLGDLEFLRKRSRQKDRYILCELEMQAHYMRSLIAHTMGIIGSNCDLYQVFTAPSVYSYMWSLHPATRRNNIYRAILPMINAELEYFPWARTNKSLGWKTKHADARLKKQFQDYQNWISKDLFDVLYSQMDFDALKNIGIFSVPQIKKLCSSINKGDCEHLGPDLFVWFVSLCKFIGIVTSTTQIVPNTGNWNSSNDVVTSRCRIYAVKKNLKRFKSLVWLSRFAHRINKTVKLVLSLAYYPAKRATERPRNTL